MKLFNNTKKQTKSQGGNESVVDLNAIGVEVDLAPGLCNLYSPQVTEVSHVRDIADILLEQDKITSKQFDQIRQEEQRKAGTDIERIVRSSGISENDVLEAKAGLYGFEFRHIAPDQIDRTAFGKLSIDYIKSNRVLPLSIENEELIIATSNPADVFSIDDVKRQTGMNIRVVVCANVDIDTICNELDETKFDVDEIMNDLEDVEVVQETEEDVSDLEKSAGESPVIKFVNFLLTNALREGASDIHIEPKEKFTKVRYRIDGMLFDVKQAPARMHPAIVSRLKIMANLDISERRLPQDGKIAVRMGGRGIDLRVSVLPVSNGEKVVIRILDSSSIMRGLDNSGMEDDVTEEFRQQIALPHGILLVTGPTGSGKSTTLYSALGEMKSDHLNVSTVEDPVEYNLEFCNQVQVHDQIGMTFAAALRSLLRQDPDIIMVGEIRDQETARIAVQAALTGHLVLSTLHTNDAPSSVSRLVNIGVEPYLIAASLNGILAQRLVRRICPHCKEHYKIPVSMQKYVEAAGIEPKELLRGKGCDQCRDSGYAGRAGIFELLIVDDFFRDVINKDASVNSMRKAFQASGRDSLFNDGIKKVKKGVTTMEEVLRVTQAGSIEEEKPAKNEMVSMSTSSIEESGQTKKSPVRKKTPSTTGSSRATTTEK
ncbi:MAG: Flp pilus assembly complex ATPase component TadA [Sedimentisphaerales bacterium]|nr:Flp pilus assembly complex ATPase component TadA [Sedimentisphaerales bacterium]